MAESRYMKKHMNTFPALSVLTVSNLMFLICLLNVQHIVSVSQQVFQNDTNSTVRGHITDFLYSLCVTPFVPQSIDLSVYFSSYLYLYACLQIKYLFIHTARALLLQGRYGQLPVAPRFLGPPNCSLKKSFLSLPIHIYIYIWAYRASQSGLSL